MPVKSWSGVVGLGLVVATSLAVAPAAERVVDDGQFRLDVDELNAALPTSLEWRGTPLLDAERGLGWSFTSFECRSKIYREENRHVWAGKDEPRFATDVGPVTTKVVRADGATTVRSTYDNSFAAVERRIVVHDTEPRLRIECDFRFTRKVVVHEPDMFRLAVGFAPALAAETVADVRRAPAARFTRTCRDSKGHPTGARFEVSLLPAGPMLVQTADGSLTLIVTGGVSGDVPAGACPKPLVFAPDARLTFTIDVRVVADAATAATAWEAAIRDMPATHRPAALLRLGDAFAAEKEIAAAEAVYLEAARLDATFATPYGRLAGLRRDHPDVPGAVTQAEAWIEGAYRQPYDFGYILSGRGIAEEERLTEEQRRLAIFNILISMENNQFNADFYCWAARPFEKLGMHAQACAIYRQALWAADHMPRSEEQREKHRALCRTKIAELERALVGETVEALPPLIPIRVPRDAPPAAEPATFAAAGRIDPLLPDCGIQAVIDEAAAAGGGTVVLPAGRFPLARSLVLASGVTLAGQGETTILAAAVDEHRAAIAPGLAKDATAIELAGDLSTLASGRTIVLWPRGRLSHPKQRRIATVKSVAGTTVTLEEPFGVSTAEQAFVSWGLWTPVAAAAAAGDRSVRVADPSIFSPGAGVKLTGPGDTWDHHWNHVERIEGDTLHLARPLTVSPPVGSIVQRMHSLVTAEGVENVGVQDLVLEGFPDERKPAGGAFYLAALHTNESRSIAVRRVVVRDWHSDAFSFQAGGDLVVEDCTATGNFGHGFHPGTGFKGAEFVRLRSEGNATDGFYYCWNNHRVNVRDSTLTDNGGHGIGGLGNPGDSENVVAGNRIEGNGLAGVEMIGGPKNHGNTVVGNTIRDNSRAAPGKKPGILITAVWSESSTGAIVRDNVVESTLAEPTQWVGIEEVHVQPMKGKEDRADAATGLVLVDESTIAGNRVAGHKTADIVVRGRSSRATGNEGRVVEERP